MRLRINWRLPWVRQSLHAPTTAAPSAGSRQDSQPGVAATAPVLNLAREWLELQGARPHSSQQGVLTARLPGGDSVAYTTSAGYAREHAGAQLLAPGSAAREELLAAIASGGMGRGLRLPAQRGSAIAIARSAITVLDERKHAPRGEGDPDHQLCVDCLERDGRLIIFGSGSGIRAARFERETERATIEAAVVMSVRTHHGLREEIARYTVDTATGAVMAPLSDAHLRTVMWNDAPPPAGNEQASVQTAIAASVERAARAAGQLARLESLPDYQRQQAAITETAERQLVEAPDDARAILAARQSALDRLSATHGVTVTSRVLAWTPIIEPVVWLQVELAGGGICTLEVDEARRRVEAPRCSTCGQTWRVGARCAEGHITCLSCQQSCAHCGERHCPQCAAPEPEPCAVCGAPACVRCARATARGQHRKPIAGIDLLTTASAGTGERSTSDGTSAALSGADLDAMSPATWCALVHWYLEEQGYSIIGDVVDNSTETISFECHAPEGAARARAMVVSSLSADLTGGSDPRLARRLAGERQQRPDASLVLVTRFDTRHRGERTALPPGLTLVDRDELLEFARRQAGAFGHAQEAAEHATDERAAAAQAVQQTLRTALLAAAVALTDGASPGAAPSAASPATVERVERDARVLHQVLLACDTLSDDWIGLFGGTPTRAHALDVEGDNAAIERLATRAAHLGEALHQAAAEWGAAPQRGARPVLQWRAALGEECALHCRLIASKLMAINPAAWRDFDTAHPAGAAAAIGEAQAAWQRTGLRARRLRDECEASASQRAPQSAPRR